MSYLCSYLVLKSGHSPALWKRSRKHCTHSAWGGCYVSATMSIWLMPTSLDESTDLCYSTRQISRQVARSEPHNDHVRTLRAVTVGMPKHWKRAPGRTCHIWTRKAEDDAGPLNISFTMVHATAQRRSRWWRIIETAMLQLCYGTFSMNSLPAKTIMMMTKSSFRQDNWSSL